MQCSKQRRRAWNLWDQGWAELALQEQLGRSRAAPRATAQTRCEGDQTPVRERGENTHHVLQEPLLTTVCPLENFPGKAAFR